MIRIAICDDDRFIHKQLAEIIMAYSIFTNEEINLIYFITAESLLASTEKYDILFLDIRFNRKDIGIEIARKIRQKGSECIIILLTSLDTKTIEGYTVGAYRYIVKPTSKKEIYAVLNEAIAKLKNSSKVLLVKEQYGTEIIHINEIIYIQSVNRKRLVVLETITFETWETHKNFYLQLPHYQFGYAQKGCIVNYDKISEAKKNDVTVINGETISVSRQYKVQFFSDFFEYVGR